MTVIVERQPKFQRGMVVAVGCDAATHLENTLVEMVLCGATLGWRSDHDIFT